VRRGLDDSARTSPVITNGLHELTLTLRAQLRTHFGEEFTAAGPRKRDVLSAVEAATSYDTWHQLRDGQGGSVSRASRAVTLLLTGALQPQ
jgi:hypothetical protein